MDELVHVDLYQRRILDEIVEPLSKGLVHVLRTLDAKRRTTVVSYDEDETNQVAARFLLGETVSTMCNWSQGSHENRMRWRNARKRVEMRQLGWARVRDDSGMPQFKKRLHIEC